MCGALAMREGCEAAQSIAKSSALRSAKLGAQHLIKLRYRTKFYGALAPNVRPLGLTKGCEAAQRVELFVPKKMLLRVDEWHSNA